MKTFTKNDFQILDTTLRDGAYVVDFQFSANQVAGISRELDQSGVKYIELGHGLGLGASRQKSMKAKETDVTYLQVAAKTIKHAKWGMFFIPGIGNEDDLKQARDFGMHFVRIGVDPNRISQGISYLRHAKKLGFEVYFFIMKSYILKPDQFAQKCVPVMKEGADVIYLVDSAGGMLPESIKIYIEKLKSKKINSIGFHGHNNLGLAVANSLVALEHGAVLIDTSVRGLGRSLGNAVSEMFLLALKKKGVATSVDIFQILDLADRHIDPLLNRNLLPSSLDIFLGYTEMHSSFIKDIQIVADKFKVDLKKLIYKISQKTKVKPESSLVTSLARQLKQEKQKND